MLTKIKATFTGFFAKLILIILTAAFVIVGFYGYNTRDVNTLATVNGEIINAREYDRVYQSILDETRNNGSTSREEQERYRQIALNSLINQKLLTEKLNDLLLTAGDVEVAEYIVSIPDFRTDQRFDKKKLDEYIRSQNYSIEDFENSIREQLSVNNLSSLVRNTFKADSEKIAENLLIFGNTAYNIRALEFDKNVVKKSPPKKTDAELTEYYNANKSQYVSEKGFDLQIVRYDQKDVVDSINITEAELRNVFQQQKQMFTQPAGYQISRIFFPKNVKGSKYRSSVVLKTLKSYPFNFEKYIRKYSKDEKYKATKGVLPLMSYGSVPEYDKVIKGLKAGEFAREVIEMEDGYALIKLIERRDAWNPEFEEVSPFLEEQLKYEQARQRLKPFGDQLKTEILKEIETNPNFEDVFAKRNKTAKDQLNFTTSTQLANKENARTLYYALLEKPEGFIGMHTFEDNTFVFFKIIKTHPSVQYTFDEVKGEIKEELNDQYYAENAEQLFEKYSVSVKDKLTFNAMVKELKAKKDVIDTSFTSSGAVIPKIGAVQILKDELKKMNNQDIGNAVSAEDASRKFIVVLDNIEPYTVKKDSEEFKKIRANLETQINNLYLNDIQNKLVVLKKKKSEIIYNNTALEQFSIATPR